MFRRRHLRLFQKFELSGSANLGVLRNLTAADADQLTAMIKSRLESVQ